MSVTPKASRVERSSLLRSRRGSQAARVQLGLRFLGQVLLRAPDGVEAVGAAEEGLHHVGVEVLAGLKAGDRVAIEPVKAGLAGAVPAAQ